MMSKFVTQSQLLYSLDYT